MTCSSSNLLALFGAPGWVEITVVLVVAVLLFGRRLPEIARGMGKSLTEFKKGIKEADDAKQDVADEIDKAVENDKPHADDASDVKH